MKRKAPSPRPRGAKWPDYQRLDGSFVHVVPERDEQSNRDRPADPGPDSTAGEELFAQFLDILDCQQFNYVDNDNGDLRQYWCPQSDGITAAVDWHCENCGEWFNVGDIDEQTDKPDVRIPYDVAFSLARAFNKLFYEPNASDPLALKAGKKRTTFTKYHLQKYAAVLVYERLGIMGKTAACDKVAEIVDEKRGDPIGTCDGRTIANWFKKFYPQEK